MLRAIQPILLPCFVLGAEYAAIKLKWLENEMFIGVILGLGLFWLLWSILSNQHLIRRLPWLVEWAPFLANAESAAFASGDTLSRNYLHRMTIRLADLADSNNNVRNRTFEDCDIYGPGVVITKGIAVLADCTFDEAFDSVTWQLPEQQKKIIGAIALVDCSIRNCRFHRIGVVVPPHLMDKWREANKK